MCLVSSLKKIYKMCLGQEPIPSRYSIKGGPLRQTHNMWKLTDSWLWVSKCQGHYGCRRQTSLNPVHFLSLSLSVLPSPIHFLPVTGCTFSAVLFSAQWPALDDRGRRCVDTQTRRHPGCHTASMQVTFNSCYTSNTSLVWSQGVSQRLRTTWVPLALPLLGGSITPCFPALGPFSTQGSKVTCPSASAPGNNSAPVGKWFENNDIWQWWNCVWTDMG